MPAPYNLGQVTLTRGGTLRVVAVRGGYGEDLEQPCWDSEGNWCPITHKQIGGMNVSGAITIYKGNSFTQTIASLEVSWAGQITFGELPPGTPLPCPDDGEEGTSSYVLHNTQSQAGIGQAAIVDTPVARYSGNFGTTHSMYFHDSLPGETVSFTRTADLSLQVSGLFTMWGSPNNNAWNPELTGYERHLEDHDTYGLDSRYLEIWYVPAGPITVTAMGPCGSHSWDITADDFESQSEFESFFKWGLGAVTLQTTPAAGCDSPPGWSQAIVGATGTVTGSGMVGGSGPGISLTQPGLEQNVVSYNPATGVFTMTYDGQELETYNPRVDVIKGGFAVPYTAPNGDFDGAGGRSGTVTTAEYTTEPDNAVHPFTVPYGGAATYSSNGNFDLHYGFGYGGNDLHRKYCDYNTAGSDYYSNWAPYTMHGAFTSNIPAGDTSHYGGLTGLDALGEPRFPPLPPTGEEGDDHWKRWYDDARIAVEPNISAFHWDDAIQVDVANETTVATFNSVSGWTVEQGEATLSVVDGKLRAQVTAGPCKLKKTGLSGKLNGARLGVLNFSGNALTLEIGTKAWDVQPGTPFDVLAPKSATGTDAVQVAPANPPGVTWGVWGVSEIAVSGLSAGQTYVFENLKGQRVPQADGGFVEVQVFSEAFRGYCQDVLVADRFTKTEGLAIYVDGLCAGTWGGGLLSGLLSGLAPGVGGLLSVTINEHGNWKQAAEVHSYHLTSGCYHGWNQAVVPARLKVAFVCLPLAWPGSYAMKLSKRLRGVFNVTIVDAGGEFKARDFIVEQRHTSNGSVVASQAFTTNKCGWKRTSGFQQPIHPHDNFYKIKVRNRQNEWVALDTEVRNRYGTRSVLIADLREQGALFVDAQVDWETGQLAVAYVDSNGALQFKRSFNHGKTFEAAKPVTDAGNPIAPALLRDHFQRHRWGLLWTDDTSTKLAWSEDGFATKEVVTIMTGVKHVRAVTCPRSGAILFAGWRDSDDSIVAARSFDHGTTLSTPVVAVAAVEQAFGLCFGEDEKRTINIVYIDGTGTVKVRYSRDLGLTWADLA